jgi:hypothetical protein
MFRVQAMKEYSDSRGIPPTSALDRDGWSPSRPGRFTLGKYRGTQCTGGNMGPSQIF